MGKICPCFVVFGGTFRFFPVSEHSLKKKSRCVHEQRGGFRFCPPNSGGVVLRTGCGKGILLAARGGVPALSPDQSLVIW